MPIAALSVEALERHTAQQPARRTVEAFLATLTADPPLEDVIDSSVGSDGPSDLVARKQHSQVRSMRSKDGSSVADAAKIASSHDPPRKRKRDAAPVPEKRAFGDHRGLTHAAHSPKKRKKALSDSDDPDKVEPRRQAQADIVKDRSKSLASRILSGKVKLKPGVEKLLEDSEDADEDAEDDKAARKRARKSAVTMLGPMAGKHGDNVASNRITGKPGFLSRGAASGRKSTVASVKPLADLAFDELTFLNRPPPARSLHRKRQFREPPSRKQSEEQTRSERRPTPVLQLDVPSKWRDAPASVSRSSIRLSPQRRRLQQASASVSGRDRTASPAPSTTRTELRSASDQPLLFEKVSEAVLDARSASYEPSVEPQAPPRDRELTHASSGIVGERWWLSGFEDEIIDDSPLFDAQAYDAPIEVDERGMFDYVQAQEAEIDYEPLPLEAEQDIDALAEEEYEAEPLAPFTEGRAALLGLDTYDDGPQQLKDFWWRSRP